MKKPIYAILLLITCAVSFSSCAESRTETAQDTHKIIVYNETAPATSSDVFETKNVTEITTEITAGTVADLSESEIAFVYVDNWGVVHNIWELSYRPECEPPYFYEYRQSGTPHQSVVKSCPVSKEDGDKLFELFKELDIINEPDETICVDIRIPPSSVSFGYIGDDTVYHRYTTAEKYLAIMDELFKIGENAAPPTND